MTWAGPWVRGATADPDQALGAGPSVRLSVAAIVHVASGMGYIARAQGGIEAVALASGRTAWTSDEVDRPLTASGESVAAQVRTTGPVLGVAFLDARSRGEVRARSSPHRLPRWVAPSPWAQQGIYEFESEGRVQGGRALVTWRAHLCAAAGRCEGHRAGSADRWASGTLRIDPRSGQTEELRTNEPPPPSRDAVLYLVRERLNAPSISYSYWLTAQELTGTSWSRQGEGFVLDVARWGASDGRERFRARLTPVGTVEPSERVGTPIFSADGRHVVVPRSLGPANARQFEMSVYEAHTGRRIGRYVEGPGRRVPRYVDPSSPHTVSFVVVGRLLVHVARGLDPREARLAALDVTDGSERWSRPLRPYDAPTLRAAAPEP